MSVTERVIVIAALAVAVVALIAWVFSSFRRGLGPPLRGAPVTRGGRRRVNESYAKHGWAKPFDEAGNLLPAKDRERPEGDPGRPPR